MNNIIRCPSCAGSLPVVPNTTFMFCKFCGSKIQLGSVFSNVSGTIIQKPDERLQMAYRLASMIEAVKEPMLNIENQRKRLEYLKNECRDARLRYEEFLANPVEMPGINRDAQENALRGRIQFLGNQVVEARQKYFEYENTLARYPHLNIPTQYQNADALNYILNLFYSQQAFCLMEAFGKYEDYLRKIRSASAQQSEQFFQSGSVSYQDVDSYDDYNDNEILDSYGGNEHYEDMISEQDEVSDVQLRFIQKSLKRPANRKGKKANGRFSSLVGQKITDRAKEMAKEAAADKAKEFAVNQTKEMAKRALAGNAKKMAKNAVVHKADPVAKQLISQQTSKLAKGAGKKIGNSMAQGVWKGLKKGL